MLVHRSIPSSRPTGHAQPLPQRTRPPPAARQHPCHRTGLTRPPFATYDGCSTPTPPSNRPAYTGNGTSSGTDTGSRHDCIQLVFRGVKPRSMTAFAGTLSVASPVLNELLKVPLDKPGVLELPNEDPEQWATVLRVVQPTSYISGPSEVVTWVSGPCACHLTPMYLSLLPLLTAYGSPAPAATKGAPWPECCPSYHSTYVRHRTPGALDPTHAYPGTLPAGLLAEHTGTLPLHFPPAHIARPRRTTWSPCCS